MKAHLYKFLILAAFGCLIFPTAAKAQKNKKPIKKIIADSAPKTKKPTTNSTLSPLEIAVLVEINQARSDPQKFIPYLEEYRKHLKGSLLELPNRTPMQMIEGLPAVNDAISDIKKMAKVDAYEVSGGLSKVARGQLTDLQENPKLKHLGKDGSDLESRLFKVGFAGMPIAENISYRADTAREIVLNMIIDDGVKSRSHRKNIFSQSFKFFGVACGAAVDKRNLCVIEFASSFKDK